MFRSLLPLSLAIALTVYGQQFEVATVKLSPPPAGDLINLNINLGTARNDKITLTNASLSDYLKFAYGAVSDVQISGPDWIKSKAVRFDLVAQASLDTPREQLQFMLQALLAERLNLALHREQKEFSYLALVPGKNSSKLREAKPDAVLSAVIWPGLVTYSAIG